VGDEEEEMPISNEEIEFVEEEMEKQRKRFVKTKEEIEFEKNGFYQPPKISRKLPLPHKSVDPNACYDILDDLYAFYFDTEVCE
jgi:hypothetical protein